MASSRAARTCGSSVGQGRGEHLGRDPQAGRADPVEPLTQLVEGRRHPGGGRPHRSAGPSRPLRRRRTRRAAAGGAARGHPASASAQVDRGQHGTSLGGASDVPVRSQPSGSAVLERPIGHGLWRGRLDHVGRGHEGDLDRRPLLDGGRRTRRRRPTGVAGAAGVAGLAGVSAAASRPSGGRSPRVGRPLLLRPPGGQQHEHPQVTTAQMPTEAAGVVCSDIQPATRKQPP